MPTPSSASFGDVVGRLDEIGDAVRSKGTSLEESLDLLDEAIDLGLSAVELVDAPEPEREAAEPEAPAARN